MDSEIDVQLTEDGVPMVIHDSNLFRLAGIKKEISSMTYAEVKKLRSDVNTFVRLFGHIYLLYMRLRTFVVRRR